MSRQSETIDQAEAHKRAAFARFIAARDKARATGCPVASRAADDAYDLFLQAFLDPDELRVRAVLKDQARLVTQVHFARS